MKLVNGWHGILYQKVRLDGRLLTVLSNLVFLSLEVVLTKEFERSRKNRGTITRSGSANKKITFYDYLAQLSFLRDVMTVRNAESNIQAIQPEGRATTATPENSPAAAAPLYPDIEITSAQPFSSVIRDTKSIRNARKRRSNQVDEPLLVSHAQNLKNEMTTDETVAVFSLVKQEEQ